VRFLKTILFAILLIVVAGLTFYLATDYRDAAGRSGVPFAIWLIDLLLLFIHEAGHFLFGIFGRFFHFLGGTLLQILLPVVTAIVFAKGSIRSLPFTLYLCGHSMVNASVYIGDAPYKKLKLVSSGAIHDWNWIFTRLDMMEYAESIASIVNVLGIFTCIIGIVSGFIILVIDVRSSANSK